MLRQIIQFIEKVFFRVLIISIVGAFIINIFNVALCLPIIGIGIFLFMSIYYLLNLIVLMQNRIIFFRSSRSREKNK